MATTATDSTAQSLWRRRRGSPLRAFLQTESGSGGVLLGAVVLALVWANAAQGSYDALWQTRLGISVGDLSVAHDLRTWVNDGAMTLFFLVVGLEARREFDLGDLRERRRVILPFLAALVGMAIPILIFLAANAATPAGQGWGVTMSSDTALALGLLNIVGRGAPQRVRVFLLTIFVVDDLASLLVITFVYSNDIQVPNLIAAAVAFGLLLLSTALHLGPRWLPGLLGFLLWAALLNSGVDPVVAGLLTGLSASAYTPERNRLEQATRLVRQFREQPTPDLARSASLSLTTTLSPNERLQARFHPWTSYLIVPVFALANAGIALSPGFLRQAYTSPLTLGILAGYVIGKPVGVFGGSFLVTRLSKGRAQPPIGWGGVLGSGTLAGIGLTVALLIADRAFSGMELAEAKLGVLSAAAMAALLTWLIYRMIGLLPAQRRARTLIGDASVVQDLVPAVDVELDHVRGPVDAAITVIEFGDFQCPHCGQAESIARSLLAEEDVRFVWRHLPLTDVHPDALLAAEATEAAATQGKFWEMHDLLLAQQNQLTPDDLLRHARQLGLDVDRFDRELSDHTHQARVAQDVESADLSGATGTPTFFINGARHYGSYDRVTLAAAITTAQAQLQARKHRRQAAGMP
ncbi:Na+/H+ antiporter NhaA [Microlunatus elymi]|uniref:Na(+)/H(+) antiporter NhaA n=1 Tax=Microlunatus elymi TaxID=2596828 RepID=A0A516Q301_9ACTN|nr:Na+/H+ antiporter NhaA [Microlunatus elymi]QDP97788.1 Na+/H+ antiporter NhaA [Microlunatus elymi]